MNHGKTSKRPARTAKPRSANYLKLVEWSQEDGCFVGSAPPLIGPSCHGDDQVKVYAELCIIVEEWLALLDQDGIPVGPGTLDKDYSGKFNLRPGRDLHKALEIRATQHGESLNAYCVRALRDAVAPKSAV